MTATVRVTTAELVNPDAGHDKFYRAYVLPNGQGMRQWGSQRNGRGGGDFKADTADGAASTIRRKIRENYTAVAEYTFQVPEERLANLSGKELGKMLDNIRGSFPDGRDDNPRTAGGHVLGAGPTVAPVGAPPTPTAPSAAAQVGTDSLTTLTDRVQRAITLAVTNPAEAMVEFSALGADMETLEEQTLRLRSYYDTLETLVIQAVTGS